MKSLKIGSQKQKWLNKSIFVAQRHLLDVFQVAAHLKTVNPMNLELVSKLIFAGAARHELDFTLRELDCNVDFLGCKEMWKYHNCELLSFGYANLPPSTSYKNVFSDGGKVCRLK